MSSGTPEGKWNEVKGKLREKWARLTDSDWNGIAGKKDRLIGRLQDRYGFHREQAQREVDQTIDMV